jgi:hypothetical protein
MSAVGLASFTGVRVGDQLIIDFGAGAQEVVTIREVALGNNSNQNQITAFFAQAHSAGAIVRSGWQRFSYTSPLRTSAGAFAPFADEIRLQVAAGGDSYWDGITVTFGSSQPAGLYSNAQQDQSRGMNQEVTFSATPTFDHKVSNFHRYTLGGNVTAITLSNGIVGETLEILFVQDGTGNRTVAGWPASVKWAGGVAPTITVTASKADLIRLLWDGTNWWDAGLRQNQ